ncbi:hypothetical protein [Phytohabitans houttuyneae]|uniref:Uncharacterized protein n=1 Tax=Phytohabitans houttuyneae TaxID=1076126 RepID=A0A6V8KJA2_9ACTN|nr:hypothetical protein [Phytohabitans houttuyneae]GFJ81787.1 hypothetical protein Phou_059670 [Phytohabitans houttuyneae]
MRPPSRRVMTRLLAVAAVLVVAIATMLVLRLLRDEPPAAADGPAADVPRDVYAFLSEHELGVVRDATVVGRQLGTYAGAPHWTTDGRYAFAVSAGSGGEQVVAIDWAGTVTSVPCGCRTAAPGPGGRIVWVTGGKLMSLAPGTTAAQVDPRAVPPPPPAAFDPAAVGTDGERVFLAQETVASASISSDALLAVAAGGKVDTIEADTGTIVLMRQSAVDRDAPVAYTVEHRDDACRIRRDVHLLAGNGLVTVTDAKAAGGDGRDAGRSVDDIWWGRDGRLYATMSSWRCVQSPSSERESVGPHALWRLDGGAWVAVEGTASRAWRQLAADHLAVIETDGALYSERGGQRTHLADKVVAIHAPPVAGPADSAITPRGRPVPTAAPLVITPDGVGAVRLGAPLSGAERAGLVHAREDGDCTTWEGQGELEGMTVYPDRAGNASYIWIVDGDLKTANGMGIGTPVKDLRATYGPAVREYVSPSTDLYRGYFVDEAGNSIVFLTGGTDAVQKILIGPTEPMQGFVDAGEVYC